MHSTKTAVIYAVLILGVGVLEACHENPARPTAEQEEAKREQTISDANAQIIACHDAHMQAATSVRYRISVQCLPEAVYPSTKTKYE